MSRPNPTPRSKTTTATSDNPEITQRCCPPDVEENAAEDTREIPFMPDPTGEWLRSGRDRHGGQPRRRRLRYRRGDVRKGTCDGANPHRALRASADPPEGRHPALYSSTSSGSSSRRWAVRTRRTGSRRSCPARSSTPWHPTYTHQSASIGTDASHAICGAQTPSPSSAAPPPARHARPRHQASAAGRGNALGSNVVGPTLHERAARLKQVGSEVGRTRLVLARMGERTIRNVLRCSTGLCHPVGEARPQSMNGRGNAQTTEQSAH